MTETHIKNRHLTLFMNKRDTLVELGIFIPLVIAGLLYFNYPNPTLLFLCFMLSFGFAIFGEAITDYWLS